MNGIQSVFLKGVIGSNLSNQNNEEIHTLQFLKLNCSKSIETVDLFLRRLIQLDYNVLPYKVSIYEVIL